MSYRCAQASGSAGCSCWRRNSWARRPGFIDGQQLGKPAQIVAAIVAFAILGKASDWLIVAVSSPFLRWEDRFART
jgi:hypothetical protein